jgi:lipopolysaccharide/colanic/teichoic acid biosynthesis glycosyltransferase
MNNHLPNISFPKSFHVLKNDTEINVDHVFDKEFGFYSEEYFREMLTIERKRTERSQKPILLVMIGVENLLSSFPRKNVMKAVSLVLASSAREIDIKGWHEYNYNIGIIYTEICQDGKNAILQKIRMNLELTLGTEAARSVEVTCALFPENGAGNGAGAVPVPDLRFYPSPYTSSPEKRVSLFFKRAEDILGSTLFIILFLPLFVLISVLIKLSSKGPVFFTQTRIGRGGRPFKFIKFRSMRAGNDCSIHQDYIKKLILGEQGGGSAKSNEIYKIKNDPRVTSIGKFIRKTSLDEIPQFFNVLIGDMSLVGPRPPIPYEMESYRIWHLRRVLEIKPGITGFWQVAGRSTTTFDTMVRMDLQYITRWSLWWDIILMLRTPLAVFKGAY